MSTHHTSCLKYFMAQGQELMSIRSRPESIFNVIDTWEPFWIPKWTHIKLFPSVKPITIQHRCQDNTCDISTATKIKMKMESSRSKEVSPNTIYEQKKMLVDDPKYLFMHHKICRSYNINTLNIWVCYKNKLNNNLIGRVKETERYIGTWIMHENLLVFTIKFALETMWR